MKNHSDLDVLATVLPPSVGMGTRWLAIKQKFTIAAITPLLCTVQPKFYNKVAYAFVLGPNQYHARRRSQRSQWALGAWARRGFVLDELLRRRPPFGALNVNTEGIQQCKSLLMWWTQTWCEDWKSVFCLSPTWVCEAATDLLYSRSGWEKPGGRNLLTGFRWKFWLIEPKNKLFFLTQENMWSVRVKPREDSAEVRGERCSVEACI